MVVGTKLISIGMFVVSMMIGFFVFYLLSDLPNEERKKHVEKISSLLIEFILYIWISKIVLNLSTFLKDPLAILAYPSSSHAFYLASLFSAILFIYKAEKKQSYDLQLIISFLLLFLIGAFLYEFFQFVWYRGTDSLGPMILLTGLFLFLLLFKNHLKDRTLIGAIVLGGSVGLVILAFIQPFVTIFGYHMAPWYVVIVGMASYILINLRTGKRDGSDWN